MINAGILELKLALHDKTYTFEDLNTNITFEDFNDILNNALKIQLATGVIISVTPFSDVRKAVNIEFKSEDDIGFDIRFLLKDKEVERIRKFFSERFVERELINFKDNEEKTQFLLLLNEFVDTHRRF